MVVSALYTAFSNDSPVDTAALAAEVENTMPLSVTMAEKIEGMRAWADGRTVRAN